MIRRQWCALFFVSMLLLLSVAYLFASFIFEMDEVMAGVIFLKGMGSAILALLVYEVLYKRERSRWE